MFRLSVVFIAVALIGGAISSPLNTQGMELEKTPDIGNDVADILIKRIDHDTSGGMEVGKTPDLENDAAEILIRQYGSLPISGTLHETLMGGGYGGGTYGPF